MLNEKKIEIVAEGAPSEGASAQAIRSGDLIYLASQTGHDPETGKLPEDLDGQTEQMLANVDTILAAAGCTKEDIVMVTLIFSYIKLFKRVDEIYADWIPPREEIPLPGVTAFASDHLPDGALLQIDVIAAAPSD